MKYFSLIALFFITLQVQAQIAIDEPIEKEIVATPFDGSFMKFPFTIKEDVALGMNGEKVTFIKLSTFDFKNEDGSRVGYDKEDDFINKTFEIIGYEKDTCCATMKSTFAQPHHSRLDLCRALCAMSKVSATFANVFLCCAILLG